MNVGELFISLGVKGADKAVGAIASVKDGLAKTRDMSLEAKAGILGALYALEQLVAGSNHTGAELTNLSTVLGITTEDLQRYQWAAQQVNVSNQSVTGSFLALQSAMTKLMTKGTANEWFPRFAQMAGVTGADLAELQKHPEQMLMKLQQYANKEKNKGLLREVLSNFGLDAGMISALERNAFRPEILARAPVQSASDIAANSQNNVEWANLATKFEQGIGHLNAKFGGKLVKDISGVSAEVIRLVDSFARLADKIHLIEGIGKIFEGWDLIFNGLIKVVDAFSDPKKMADLKKNMSEFFTGQGEGGIGSAEGAVADFIPGVNGEKVAGAMNEKIHIHFKDGKLSIQVGEQQPIPIDLSASPVSKSELEKFAEPPKKPSSASPTTPTTAPKTGPNQAAVDVQQTFVFNDKGRDALGIGHEVKKAVSTAFRQIPSLTQVT